MRPRRIRRGWFPVPCSSGALLGNDFNEAPANSPGMAARAVALPHVRSPNFNEAPANSPGMGGAGPAPKAGGRTHFNEAPANSPGMDDPAVRGVLGAVLTSMRPRRIRRGWRRRVPETCGAMPDFNEAPANSPGMGGAGPAPKAGGRTHFNEAPANSPGMDDPAVRGVLGAVLTSMRPRRIRRGWRRRVPETCGAMPDFNEAPANSPGMGERVDPRAPDEPATSMRPRRIRRGWPLPDGPLPRQGCPTSMRPRRIRRGWPRILPDGPSDVAHFNEAPANSPGMDESCRTPFDRTISLQ